MKKIHARGEHPAFPYPAMRFISDDDFVSLASRKNVSPWRNIKKAIMKDVHADVLPIKEMLQLVKLEYDEYDSV